MHGEELVVGVGLDEVARRGEQFETDEEREETTDEEEKCNRNKIEQRDALVVSSKRPDHTPYFAFK